MDGTLKNGQFISRGLRAALIAGVLAIHAPGCSSGERRSLTPDTPPRSLRIIDVRTDRALDYEEVVEAVSGAEVVVLGEEHDDLLASRLQLELLESLHRRKGSTVLALEMVERDEGPLLQDYLAGAVDEETLLTGLHTTEAGRAVFRQHTMPLLELARTRGIPVVAANAPRRYVRAARLQGYDHLRSLPEETRALYCIPEELDRGDYRRRVEALMRRGDVVLDPDRVDDFMRAQELWDQTMADSVLQAVDAGDGPVVLVVGRFHGDFGGGTIERILERDPGIDVRYLVTLGTGVGPLRLEDADRADYVVYTGKPSG